MSGDDETRRLAAIVVNSICSALRFTHPRYPRLHTTALSRAALAAEALLAHLDEQDGAS